MPHCLGVVASSAIQAVPSFATRIGRARHGLRALLLVAVLAGLGAAGARAATITVNTLSDSNDGSCATTCSLRDAITSANPGDTIAFGVTGTITLTSTLPAINVNLTIQGQGATLLTISGNNNPSVGSVFTVNSGVTVSIAELTIANGIAPYGAGVLNLGTLNLLWAAFSGNSATTNGGGVFSGGNLLVFDSTFSGNSVNCCAGGAIVIYSGTATIINSTFNGNSAAGGGGILNNGTMSVNNGTFSGNSATGSGSGGAILNYGTLTADNTIFSANSAGGAGAGIDNNSGTVSAAYNLFYNNHDSGATEDDCNGCTSTNSTFGADPRLLPLAYYGGNNVETMEIGPGSPAVCAGSSTYEVGPPANSLLTGFDERFFPVDPTCPTGKVDAGAVQTNQSVVTTLVDQVDSSPDCTSGTGNTCSLRDAMGLGVGDITFLPSLTSTSSPGTVTLDIFTDEPGPLVEALQANILGPGANQLTISAGNTPLLSIIPNVFKNQGFLGLYGLTITGGFGGGINNGGTMTVVDCAITRNQSLGIDGIGGGGIINDGPLAVIDSTISGNSAPSEFGGGILNTVGTVTVTGSTISGNSADTGGGIVNLDTMMVTGSTISGNTGTTADGGIQNSGTLTIANSIVAGNMGSRGTLIGPDVYGAAIDGGHNLIGDPTSSTGFTNGINGTQVGTSAAPLNPQLSPLQSTGIGAVLQTMIPLPGSPAICTGAASLVPPGTTTDERGYPLQPIGGYCASGTVDSGAVQSNYTSVAFVQQPSDVNLNTPMSSAPTVQVLETDTLLGSTDAVNGVPVTLTDLTGHMTGGSATTSGGLATFSNLQFSESYFHDTLSTAPIPVVGSTDLASVTSNTFNVGAAVSKFAISVPSTATAGIAFFPSVIVSAEDSAGNVIGGFSDTVSIAPNFTSSFTPTSTLTVTCINGVCTFSNLVMNTAGVFTITATDNTNPSLTVTSGPITVVASAPVAVIATTGLSQSTYVNTPFPTPLGAAVLDAYNNTVAGVAVTFSTTASGADGIFLDGFDSITGITDSNGQVSEPITANSITGSYIMSVSLVGGLIQPGFSLTNNPPPGFVVNSTADDNGAAPSNCPANPSSSGPGNCTLRDALAAASGAGAGAITFDSGVFSAPATITLTHGALTIPKNTSISGPYTGAGDTLQDRITVNGNSFDRVFQITDMTVAGSISGLAITNGRVAAIHGGVSGGGIKNEGTLTVAHCIISANVAGGTAVGAGGGIFNDTNGDLEISDSIIENNGAQTGSTQGALGGGIASIGYLNADHIIVTGNIISGSNASNLNGAGISAEDGQITNSTIANNQANQGGGGGLVAGAGLEADGQLVLANSTVTGNITNAEGAGVGGGIYVSGTLTILNSTISGNTSDDAGGLYNAGNVNIANSILSGNTAPASPDLDQEGSLNDNGGNVTGASSINLTTLGTFGGPTQTMVPLPGSPAICAGLSSKILSGVTKDQRGFANTNTSYTGYSSSPCVDSGAVQTDYSLNFTYPVPDTTYLQVMNPGPQVTLSEIGGGIYPTGVFITMADSGSALWGISTTQAPTSSGEATFNNLVFNNAVTGDTLIASITSPPVSQASNTFNVTAAHTTTNALGANTTYSPAPQFLTLYANVITPTGQVNSGTVTFGVFLGSTQIGSSVTSPTVLNGSTQASYVLPAGTSAGTYSIVATYNSAADFQGSSDNSQTLTVNQAQTTTTASNASVFALGVAQNVTLNATVTSIAGTVNEGQVTFTVLQGGSTPVGTATSANVINGTASVSYALPAALTSGAYTIQAAYITASGNLLSTEDNTHTLTVNAIPQYVVTVASDDGSGVAGNCVDQNTGLSSTGSSNNTNCALRDAVTAADNAGAGNITFSSLFNSPQTIQPTNAIYSNAGDSINPVANISITGPAGGVTLDGTNFTFNTGNGLLHFGMGRTVSLSKLTLQNTPGPALSIYENANATVSSCTFSSNQQAIDAEDPGSDGLLPQVNIGNSTITGNAGDPFAGLGGGIYVNPGIVTVTESTLAGNSASEGGAAYIGAGALSFTNSTFSSNSASSGGGIYIDQPGGVASLTVNGSTFSGNQATNGGGGGLFVNTGTARIQLTTFSGNTSTANGGAINSGGTVTLTNVTVSGNSSGAFAGGIDNEGPSFTLANTIVAGNTAGSSNPDGIGGFTSGGHNLIGDSTGMSGLTNGANGDQVGVQPLTINPNLAALGNNGGPTLTMLPLPGSAAICAGLASIDSGAGITTDQRGFGFLSTYCPSGAVDAGAVQTNYDIEFAQQPPAAVAPGQAIVPAPALSVTESGLGVSGATVSIGVTVGTLSGTTSVSSTVGTATFNGLSISPAENNETLKATLALNLGLSIIRPSNPFDVEDIPPALTTPQPGTALTCADLSNCTVTFTWTPGLGSTLFHLSLGTTGHGSTNVYDGAAIPYPTTSVQVPNIPAHAQPLYVRLHYYMNGAWSYVDYMYTEAGSPAPPALTTPQPETTLSCADLSNCTVTFSWTPGLGSTLFRLALGTTGHGSTDVYNGTALPGTTTSVQVSNIPANAQPLYARLHYYTNGAWSYVDYMYTEAGTPAPPALTTPQPGTALTCADLSNCTVTFTWTPGLGSTLFRLALGTTGHGSTDVYNGTAVPYTTTSVQVSNIPAYGQTLFARLHYYQNGVWSYIDYTYTEAGSPTAPALTTPQPGTALSNTNPLTFTWTPGLGSTLFRLTLGTTGHGSTNVYNGAEVPYTTTSAQVSNIPASAQTLFARLRYYVNGAWSYIDYTYTEPGTQSPPALTTPAPGTTLSNTNPLTFTWTPGLGSTLFRLTLGTTGHGSTDVYNGAEVPNTTTSAQVSNIPANAQPLYARLHYYINGAWSYIDYMYTEP